jgi:hypothetical protein
MNTKEKYLDGKANDYVNLVGAMALDDFETGMKWGEICSSLAQKRLFESY